MKASETHLGKILEGTNQFVVPLFQRPYTWDESRWKVLWSDLVELCDDDTDASRAKVPTSVSVFGAKQEVKTWREVLKVTLEAVRDASPDAFEGVTEHFPRLFSSKPDVFNAPRVLSSGDIYFESNLSATSVARYCQQVVEAAGYAPIEWAVETA
jgi:hypothetical protein